MNNEILRALKQEYINESDSERIRFIATKKFVTNQIAKNILKRFMKLIEEPSHKNMPSFLFVGDSKSGKTAILNEFQGRFLRIDDSSGVYDYSVPTVGTECIPHVTLRNFLDHILEETVFMAHRKRRYGISGKITELHYLFKKEGVQIFILDKICNLLTMSVSDQKQVFNILKEFSDKNGVSLILSGRKDILSSDIIEDFITKKRLKKIILPKWKDNKSYRLFLRHFINTLPLKKHSQLHKDTILANEILDLSEGLTGKIVEIINKSAIYAIKSGSEQITKKELSKIDYTKPLLMGNLFIGGMDPYL